MRENNDAKTGLEMPALNEMPKAICIILLITGRTFGRLFNYFSLASRSHRFQLIFLITSAAIKQKLRQMSPVDGKQAHN